MDSSTSSGSSPPPLPTTSSSSSSYQNIQSTSSAQTQPHQTSSEFGQKEYERRREEFLQNMLVSERRFLELRPRLQKARLTQFEKLQDAILNRRSESFQKRKELLDAEFDSRRKHFLVAKSLRLETLSRKHKAEREIAIKNLEHEKQMVKERIGEQISAKLAALAKEEQSIRAQITEHFGTECTSKMAPQNGAAPTKNIRIGQYLMEEVMPQKTNGKGNGRTTKDAKDGMMITAGNGQQQQLAEQSTTGKAPYRRHRWRDIPVIIAQLPGSSIQEDLALLSRQSHLGQT